MSVNILNEMLKPETYDEPVEYVKVVQTHISWVFLTGKYAYKVKKPVNFGFLDYSTLEKRKFFCEQEVALNSRLSKELYLGALPITEKGGKLKVNGEGNVVEYTVKMKELPSTALMSNLLKENKVSKNDVQRIAEILSDFHSRALTGGEVNEGGNLKTIKFNWNENFDQTREFIGETIEKEEFYEIKRKVDTYMESNVELFDRRIKNGRIRDCHGDVHSGSIFITNKIYIFDCIEFNTRFRYSDVAAEVAFLSMDLKYHGKEDLSKHFVKSYINFSSDEELLKLLPFYECYRAYVRGKVTSFILNDRNIGLEEKSKIINTAKKYFKLSLSYAKEL
ncbi:MAG: gluconokinase [Thermoproteota archaeon]